MRLPPLLAAAPFMLAPALAAQSSPPLPPEQGEAGVATPVGVDLQSSPTRIDALGLTIFLPVGATAETTSFGANATMGVQLPGDLGVLVVKGQRSTNPELTVAQVVDSIIEQLKRANGRQGMDGTLLATTAELTERTDDLRVAGLAGERIYMRFPQEGNDPEMVRAFSVFRVEPRQFIIFDLMTEAADLPAARMMYETTVGTMDLASRDALAARRAAGVENLQSVLAGHTPESLTALIEQNGERWERLFTPARTGDDMDAKEHGYRRLRMRTGVRGEVTGRPERNWSVNDRREGYIVELDAMALEPSLRIDTRAVYFVTKDLEEENWTVNMALRQGEITTESSVTGARSGTSMTVQLEQTGMPLTVTRPLIQGEGYVSQVLTHLMAPILVDHGQPGEYACYAYNPGTNSITLRRDVVERPADAPGLIIVRSQPDDDTPAAKHLYNEKGEFMRSELHNNRVWEPITLERLVALWERKGLPLK